MIDSFESIAEEFVSHVELMVLEQQITKKDSRDKQRLNELALDFNVVFMAKAHNFTVLYNLLDYLDQHTASYPKRVSCNS